MLTEYERRFELFGSKVALYLGVPPPTGGVSKDCALAGLEAEGTLRRLHAQLTRFDRFSELSRLNEDPRSTIPVSTSVAALAEAAVAAADLTGGLVDATQLRAIELCGYATTRVGIEPCDLSEALEAAPPRRAAQPSRRADWRHLVLDRAAMVLHRPAGVRLDSGGIAKGMAADLLATRFRDYTTFAIDCGGDLRIGGLTNMPRQVTVEHPFTDDEPAATFEIEHGAVATSGLRTRIWRQGPGFAHHLLDPSTGKPAWTGLVQATALAPTGVEAEARAKAALLSGPGKSRHWLSEHGGITVGDDGGVEAFGPVRMLEGAPCNP